MQDRTNNIPLSIDLGKVPPQSVDIEEAVLGAMIINERCTDNVLAIVKPHSFYKEEHQKICEAIIALKDDRKDVDLLTVTDRLRKMKILDEVGGPVYITHLTSRIASDHHAEMHASIVQDNFIMRELIRISSEIQMRSFDEGNDPLDVISFFQQEITNLLNENRAGNTQHIAEIIKQRTAEIEGISIDENAIIGIPTGLPKLDALTGGWQKSDLVVIAARPSMGKTAYALFSAMIAGIYKKPAAFFSLEMAKGQLIDRMFAAVSDNSPSLIRRGKVNWELLEQGIAKLERYPLYINDIGGLRLVELRSELIKLKAKYGIEIAMIDYLQLMNAEGKGQNRDREIGYLTGGLKALAKELNIPILLLSQLNRDAEGKRPVLSNLRESGNIEQDADLVIFLHRPEKYGQGETPEGIPTDDLCEIIVEKQRNGPTGIVNSYINKYNTWFTDVKTSEMHVQQEFKHYYEPKPGQDPDQPF